MQGRFSLLDIKICFKKKSTHNTVPIQTSMWLIDQKKKCSSVFKENLLNKKKTKQQNLFSTFTKITLDIRLTAKN